MVGGSVVSLSVLSELDDEGGLVIEPSGLVEDSLLEEEDEELDDELEDEEEGAEELELAEDSDSDSVEDEDEEDEEDEDPFSPSDAPGGWGAPIATAPSPLLSGVILYVVKELSPPQGSKL